MTGRRPCAQQPSNPVLEEAEELDHEHQHEDEHGFGEFKLLLDGEQCCPHHVCHHDKSPSAAAHLPLLTVALAIYTAASWLQERVSKSHDFNGPLLVLGETGAYVMIGLLWAYMENGYDGVRSCTSLSRYVMFLPASFAFFTNNLAQYPSLRVLGVVNHCLLCQLNLVVMAVMLYLWRGQHVSGVQWAALLHLSIGLIMLVALTSTSDGISAANASSPQFTTHDYVFALLAVGTCIGASAFASVYLEGALRANAHDALFVQMHQMNLVQALIALALFLRGLWTSNSASHGFTLLNLVFLALNLARGSMMAVVLKKAGSLANGVVSVGTIVTVAVLQFAFEGRRVAGLGLQLTILLSVLNYLFAEQGGKSHKPAVNAEDCSALCWAKRESRPAAAVQVCLIGSLLLFLPHKFNVLEGGLLAAAGQPAH